MSASEEDRLLANYLADMARYPGLTPAEERRRIHRAIGRFPAGAGG